MFIATENVATIAIVLFALGILGWGYYRARAFGKLGILAWLQSAILMVPWLVFFGLFAAGIYLNIVGVLFLLVISTGIYIFLGKKLRAASQDGELRSRLEAMLKSSPDAGDPDKVASPVTTEAGVNTTLPPLKIPEIVPIPAETLKSIQGIFGVDTFFATETIPYQDGVIFNGNLRGDAEKVHSRLSTSLQERLGDRYRLFLLPNQDDKPVVIVLPSTNDPKPATTNQKILAAILFVITIISCLETGALLQSIDLFTTPQSFLQTLPIGSGIIAILLAHEIGHQVMAKRHQVRWSWPFFIPTLQIGSFGALNRFESVLPNRTVLFDVALAGPAAGGLLSLAMLIIGLLLSHPGSMFQVPSEFFKGSILVGTLARVVLGNSIHNPIVDVNPLTIIGWLGLVITAINLLPAGSLDGGRIVQAIYGRKIASRTMIATLAVLAIASLANPLALYWAIVILFLQRNLERPSLNELTEPDDARAALALLALFLMIATLLPLTPGLAGRLGIGT